MIKSIGHIALRVKDMDRSLDFYTRVLGGGKVFEGTENGTVNMVYVKLAPDTYIELFVSEPGMEKTPSDIGYRHVCIVTDDIYAEEKRIKETGWPTPPVRRGKYGNIQLWLKDPDGNEMELMQILPDFLMKPEENTAPGREV